MKAIVNNKYGSPDVLQLKEINTPVPEDNEVLVRVHAASVNAWDWHNMRATPSFARLSIGLFKPKKNILGVDVAGRVEKVGRNVTQFKPGEEVYGDLSDIGGGAFAEFISADQNVFALKPRNMSFEESAAVPLAAVTALQGLRDQGHIRPGQRVLINGASGGVGTFAVQIAKSFDTEVTAVCSTRKLEAAQSIGADHVIDYTREDFTRNGQQYDLVLDTVGNRSVSDIERVLSPNGRCAVTGFTSIRRLLETGLLAPLILRGSDKQMGFLEAKASKEDLTFIKELIEAGKVVSVIDKHYSLAQVPKAIRYVEEVHAKGKVVITV